MKAVVRAATAPDLDESTLLDGVLQTDGWRNLMAITAESARACTAPFAVPSISDASRSAAACRRTRGLRRRHPRGRAQCDCERAGRRADVPALHVREHARRLGLRGVRAAARLRTGCIAYNTTLNRFLQAKVALGAGDPPRSCRPRVRAQCIWSSVTGYLPRLGIALALVETLLRWSTCTFAGQRTLEVCFLLRLSGKMLTVDDVRVLGPPDSDAGLVRGALDYSERADSHTAAAQLSALAVHCRYAALRAVRAL